MSNASGASSPILLAFSGGLDTSFCVPWLKETYGRDVVTFTVDTGGLDAAAIQVLAERSKALGAIAHDLPCEALLDHVLADGRDVDYWAFTQPCDALIS